jgi:hypothetical protein
MAATFTPPTFACPTHRTDLTSAVEKQVLSDPTLVASFGFTRRPNAMGAAEPKEFLVVVQCPGTGSGTDAHSLEFEGTVQS